MASEKTQKKNTKTQRKRGRANVGKIKKDCIYVTSKTADQFFVRLYLIMYERVIYIKCSEIVFIL